MEKETVDDIISDKIDALVLRAILINSTSQETIGKLNSEEEFLVLLETIEHTLEHDKEFFFLENFLDKTCDMIRLGSCKFSTKGDLRKKENENIVELNKLSTTQDKKEIANILLDVEYEMRECIPYTDELLYSSMANDYYIMNAIQCRLLDPNYELPKESKQFVASSSYFTYYIPELYESDCRYIEIVEEYIKQIPKFNLKQSNLRSSARKVKKRLDLFK